MSAPDGNTDRKTIGPSASNRQVLETLVELGHFKTSLAAFEAAAMLAVAKNLDRTSAESSAGTMWNRGSVPTQILEFLEWYLPTNAPARALEQLGNAGTAYIADRVRAGGYNLTELFEIARLEVDDD